MHRLFFVLAVCVAVEVRAGFPENPAANNKALIVSVSHGLPGLGIDVENMRKILTHEVNQFQITAIKESQATVSGTAQKLTEISEAVDSRGTFFFYFTGHGNRGVIQVQDRTMKIAEIRKAIEQGRATWGPLKRLVMFFDSCHSGSLLDPVRFFQMASTEDASRAFAEEVFQEMGGYERDRPSNYWHSLFVFASARADETCGASGQGSAFTLGVKKGFNDVISSHGDVAAFVTETQKATKGSHPVARFDPESLQEEKL